MSDFTDEFKINVNKLNADEQILVCLEISHPFLTAPIYLVNDNMEFINSLGNVYLPMSFELKRQDDTEGELPKLTLTLPNVGRTLVKWIDESGGGRGAVIIATLVRRSDPATVEEKLTVGISRVSITSEKVSFSLIIQNNLIKRSVRYLYDIKRSPGLF